MNPQDAENLQFPIHAGSRTDGGSEQAEWRQDIKDDIKDLKETQKELDRRLAKVERWQIFVTGAAASIGAVGGYLISWLRRE